MPQPQNWVADLSQPQPGSDAALALGWTWPAARQACDEHKRGMFAMSWQLWLDMGSLPAIRAAKERRMANPCGLPWEVIGPSRAPGRLETEAASDLWENKLLRLLDSSLDDVIGMGFSVWQHPTMVNPVTLRREVVTVERFPVGQVRFTATPFPDPWEPGKYINRYYAIQFGIGETLAAAMYGPQGLNVTQIPVPPEAYVPGRSGVWVRFIQLPRPGETDGHWTVLGRGDMPHMRGAVHALDTSYVGGAIMTRSAYNLSKTLGRQGIVGTMPQDVTVKDQEGKDMRKTVAGFGLAEAEAVLPYGADMKAVSLTSQSAGLFIDFRELNTKDVELAILGHAGAMMKEDAQYTAKDGVEVKVPQHLERADVKIVKTGFEALANLIAEQNTPSPGRIFLIDNLPDSEEDERLAAQQERDLQEAKKLQEFWKAVDAERAQGFEFTPTPEGQARLDAIAARCGVTAPKIPPKGLPPPLVKLPKPTVPITGEDEQSLPPPADGAPNPAGAAPPPNS